MRDYVGPELRRLVAERAGRRCEYCLVAEEDTFLGCEVDHVVSLKHGGPTEPDNLALACAFCNRHKGSDIGSISRAGELTRFYNPRSDRWADHFRLAGDLIEPLTEIGEVTARILKFNDGERLLERQALRAAGRYPARRVV
jgi:hypothetical protein